MDRRCPISGRRRGRTGRLETGQVPARPFPVLLSFFHSTVPVSRHDQRLILASPNARFSPIVLHHHAPSITSAACNGRVRDSSSQTTPRRQVSPALLPARRHPALPDQSKASPLPGTESSPFDPFIPNIATELQASKLQHSYFLFCLVSFVWLRIPSLDIKTPDIDTRCCLPFHCFR